MRRPAYAAALAVASTLTPRPGLAQSSVSAQALFDEGRAAMDAGNFAAACPKLAESQRLDPGGGTLMHLALCYEKLGKTASAWATFNETVSVAKRDRRDDRLKVAEEHLSLLTPKLVKLRLVVSAELRRTPGLVVRRGGEPAGQAEWGSAVPVDPGSIEVVASAPGKTAVVRTVEATQPGQTVDVELGALADAEPNPSTAAPSPTGPGRDGATSGSALPTIALVVTGVGVVGLGVGGYFGLQSMSKKSEADDHCEGAACRDQAGVDLRHDARSAGTLSTVAFAVGGVTTAAGVVLYLTAPRPQRPGARLAPQLGTSFAGIGAEAWW